MRNLSVALTIGAMLWSSGYSRRVNLDSESGNMVLKTKGKGFDKLRSISYKLPKDKETYSKPYSNKKVVMTFDTSSGLIKKLKIASTTITPQFDESGKLTSVTIKTNNGDQDEEEEEDQDEDPVTNGGSTRHLQKLDCSDCQQAVESVCDNIVASSCTSAIVDGITEEDAFVGAAYRYFCDGVGGTIDCDSMTSQLCGDVIDCECSGKTCPGGLCVAQDECCPGQNKCADGDDGISFLCTTECCIGQTKCTDGSCVAQDTCCQDQVACADAGCAGDAYETACFDCPEGNFPVPFDYKDDPDPDACCPTGQVYCDKSSSCIPKSRDCCDTNQEYCPKMKRCITLGDTCGIQILTTDCTDENTVYARCEDEELTCFFACLGISFQLEENRAFNGFVCDEPFGNVTVDNCPDIS